MIKEIFGNIKSDKKLPFSHWRFRVLHWAFGIDPKTPKQSKLPAFLYTKYCPLFHLTNLIVLFCIPILIFKIGFFLLVKSVQLIGKLVELIEIVLNKIVCFFSGDENIQVFKHRQRMNSALRELFDQNVDGSTKEKFLIDYINYCQIDNNDNFRWTYFDVLPCITSSDYYNKTYEYDNPEQNKIRDESINKFNVLYETYKVYYENNKSKMLIKKEEMEKEKLKMKERLVFAVNCSSMLFKFILNAIYAVIIAIGVYATGWAVYQLLNLLTSISYLSLFSIIKGMAKGLFYVTTVTIPVFFLIYISRKKLISFVSVMADVVNAIYDFIENKLDMVVDFVKMFYSDNCPSIEIVEDTPKTTEKT